VTTTEPLAAANGAGFALQLKVSPRARVMRLKVDPRTGAVVLTVPRRVSQKKALEWAAGHRDWVEAQLAKVPSPERLSPGSTLPLYGRPHEIVWEPARSRIPVLDGDRILIGGPEAGLEARILRFVRRLALDTLARETAESAAKAAVTVTRVGVGDPMSRWGSCSSSGAIRYSWRLILAPDYVRRATVAHEVAHRVHMDHSPRFHALVDELLGNGDAKPAREWLRRNGASLHRIARV
jgi:hypothetical protein